MRVIIIKKIIAMNMINKDNKKRLKEIIDVMSKEELDFILE